MLTTEQLALLKAAIVADPVLNALPNNTDSAFEIAAQFNALENPAFVVWETHVSVDEIMRNGMDWARVDNLTVGKARIWDWLGRLGTFDASRANVRAGIDAAWVGTAADLAVRASIYTHCKRNATRAEKVLATGTGSDASPATMTFEGTLSYQDAFNARNS
jgi:hypothetical protein